MAGISTHILDTSIGRPISGIRIELYDTDTQPFTLLKQSISNADGRTDSPMLSAEEARTGHFELRFFLNDYFQGQNALTQIVPVRFSIYDSAQHYHVPLLCSPWCFSSYRGS